MIEGRPHHPAAAPHTPCSGQYLPPPLQVIKGKSVIEGRPGASMAPLDLNTKEYRLKEKYGPTSVNKRDVLSAAMYPKVREGGARGGAI